MGEYYIGMSFTRYTRIGYFLFSKTTLSSTVVSSNSLTHDVKTYIDKYFDKVLTNVNEREEYQEVVRAREEHQIAREEKVFTEAEA